MKIAKHSAHKRKFIWIVIIASALLLVVIAVWYILQSHNKRITNDGMSSGSIYQPTTPQPAVVTPSTPLRLLIPKIKVNSAVESLGLTTEGDMDSPDGPDNTGWYKLGPKPGEIGSAVIDGHFGWKNNKPAVFDKLHTLVKGDTIVITDEAKNTHTFVVSKVRSFAPDDDATEVFKSSDNLSHLNLITCQGVWNKDQASYSTRLVVFADLKL